MAKESNAKTAVCVVLGALAVLAWGIAFGAIKSDVNHINKQADKNTTVIEAVKENMGGVRERLVRIDTRQEVMIKSLESLNDKLK